MLFRYRGLTWLIVSAEYWCYLQCQASRSWLFPIHRRAAPRHSCVVWRLHILCGSGYLSKVHCKLPLVCRCGVKSGRVDENKKWHWCNWVCQGLGELRACFRAVHLYSKQLICMVWLPLAGSLLQDQRSINTRLIMLQFSQWHLQNLPPVHTRNNWDYRNVLHAALVKQWHADKFVVSCTMLMWHPHFSLMLSNINLTCSVYVDV